MSKRSPVVDAELDRILNGVTTEFHSRLNDRSLNPTPEQAECMRLMDENQSFLLLSRLWENRQTVTEAEHNKQADTLIRYVNNHFGWQTTLRVLAVGMHEPYSIKWSNINMPYHKEFFVSVSEYFKGFNSV